MDPDTPAPEMRKLMDDVVVARLNNDAAKLAEISSKVLDGDTPWTTAFDLSNWLAYWVADLLCQISATGMSPITDPVDLWHNLLTQKFPPDFPHDLSGPNP